MDDCIIKMPFSNLLNYNVWLILCLLVCSTGSEVIKLFPYSAHLNTKFILLINVKMPTIVGILTFISMIISTFVGILVFMSSWNSVLSCVEQEKSFIILGPDILCKQYGPRSGPSKCLAWSWSKLLCTLVLFLKYLFVKKYFEKKKSADKKKKQAKRTFLFIDN